MSDFVSPTKTGRWFVFKPFPDHPEYKGVERGKAHVVRRYESEGEIIRFCCGRSVTLVRFFIGGWHQNKRSKVRDQCIQCRAKAIESGFVFRADTVIAPWPRVEARVEMETVT